MLKTFMTIWSFIRRFRALLGTGILTLIPIVNVLVTWSYAYRHATNGTIKLYYGRMVNNIEKGYSAFDAGTKSLWADIISFSILSLIFIGVSTLVNWYAFSTWPAEFDYDWIVRYNLTYWYQITGWAVTTAIILSTVGAMLNQIYNAHKDWDPDYMDEKGIQRNKGWVDKVNAARSKVNS